MARRKRPSRRKKSFIDRCIDEGNFELINKLQVYYEIKGVEYVCNLSGIFKALYLDCEKPTNREIGNRYHVSEDVVKEFVIASNFLAEELETVKRKDVS